MPWAALQADGLTCEVFLALDPHVIARSLTLFHRAILEQAPDSPTAAHGMIGYKRGLSSALAQAGLEQPKHLKQCNNSLYTEFCSSGTCLSALKQP
jgi:hypothetical protein